MTTKADLEKRIDELSETCGDYRRELNSYKERCAKAEEDLEDEKQKIDRAMNQIHFLAWMLAWNGVTIEWSWYYWLDVRVEIPPREWDRKII